MVLGKAGIGHYLRLLGLWWHKKIFQHLIREMHCWLLRSAVYVHNPLYTHEKMGTKGKIYIFIRYFEYSKEYVLIGEYDDGTIVELESWDVIFLENKFSSIANVNKDIFLDEMNDL